MPRRKAPLSKPLSEARDVARILRARGKSRYDEKVALLFVVDLLTALRHYCTTFDVDFTAAVGMSHVHWRAEHDAANKPESDGITDV